MNYSITRTHRIANSKVLHTVVFAIAMISFALNGWNAQAANVIATDYRRDAADDNFADAWKFVVAFKVRPRRRLRAKRVELATDTLSTSQENKQCVVIGPYAAAASFPRTESCIRYNESSSGASCPGCVSQAFPGSFAADGGLLPIVFPGVQIRRAQDNTYI